MSGNDAKVLLDLNYPGFQSDLFDLDSSEAKKAFKTFKKLRNMTWNDVFRDHGLKWEEPKSVPGKFTIRLSQSYRAVVVRDGGLMRFPARRRPPIYLHWSMPHCAARGNRFRPTICGLQPVVWNTGPRC